MINDTLTEQVIAAAIKVQSALGAGCFESTYHACLAHQLQTDGLQLSHQVKLPITYQDVTFDAGYRIDFLVEKSRHCGTEARGKTASSAVERLCISYPRR